MTKKIYIVLGIPRSGTSAIARSLVSLGVNFGNNLQPADSRNPRGFYEDLDVMYTINRGVSRALNYQWLALDTDPQLFDTDKTLHGFKNYAIDLIKQKLANDHSWGFKDPRTTEILPFWQDVFKSLDIEDRYVLVIRHPLAAARSLQKFANVDLIHGLILWIKFFSNALHGTENRKRVVVSYESMLQEPQQQLLRLHEKLAIETPVDMNEVKNYAENFIDKALRHHQNTDDELLNHAASTIVPMCAKLYKFAMSLADDSIVINSDAYKQVWSSISLELQKAQPVYEYIETLRAQNKTLERELRVVQKSFPWKLIYPLRMIDDLFRRHRHRNRRKLAGEYA